MAEPVSTRDASGTISSIMLLTADAIPVLVTHAIEATSGGTFTDINYENVSLPITSQTAITTSSLAINSDSTNPFTWAIGVGYTKRV